MQRQIDRYLQLTPMIRQLALREFDRFVAKGNVAQFDKLIGNITRADFQASSTIKKLWNYWYVTLPKSGSTSLLNWSEWHPENAEIANSRLKVLIARMYDLAILADEEDVKEYVAKRNNMTNRVLNTQVALTAQGAEHLRLAALCFGFEEDHFVALTQPRTVRRLEGETETQRQIRYNAAELHRELSSLSYAGSKHEPTMQTNALRALWRCFHASSDDLKQLFKANNGQHRHGAEIRKLLMMISEGYSLDTKRINEILKSF